MQELAGAKPAARHREETFFPLEGDGAGFQRSSAAP